MPSPSQLLYEIEDVTGTFIRYNWADLGENTFYWRAEAEDIFGQSSSTETRDFFVKLYVCGDANGDEAINVADAVFLINYIFKSGPAPDPLQAGDANCDGGTDVADAVYLINYVFKGGPEPCCP